MTPYYQDDLVTIYHGDSGDLAPRIGADVLVTDPPYGTRAYATDLPVGDLLSDWLRRWTNAAVFGWPENLVDLCRRAERTPDDWIVWWPTNADLRRGSPEGHTPREAEHITLFGPIRWSRGKPLGRTLAALYQGANSRGEVPNSPEGKKWGDVWTDPSPGLGFQWRQRQHPNEKPVPLMTRLLSIVADGSVLDPFMGSGSTLVAAKALGRKAIGIEIEERYCEIAATRCSQEVLGLSA
jgi:hypothetical protein